MSDELPDYAVETKAILQGDSPVFSKPKLNAKLLSKPPFRFLHDVITAVQNKTGYAPGLYAGEELDAKAIKEKATKVAYLQKMIDVVHLHTGAAISAKPLKIVAGLEPAQTNEFLQAFGRAALSGDNAAAAVQQVLAAAPPAAEAAPPPPEAAPPPPEAAPEAEGAAPAEAPREGRERPRRDKKRSDSKKERRRGTAEEGATAGEEAARPRSREGGSRRPDAAAEAAGGGEDAEAAARAAKEAHRAEKEERRRRRKEREERKAREAAEREAAAAAAARGGDDGGEAAPQPAAPAPAAPADEGERAEFAPVPASVAAGMGGGRPPRPQSAKKPPPRSREAVGPGAPAPISQPPARGSTPSQGVRPGTAQRPGTATQAPAVAILEEGAADNDDDDVEIVQEAVKEAAAEPLGSGPRGALVDDIEAQQEALRKQAEEMDALTADGSGGKHRSTGIILKRTPKKATGGDALRITDLPAVAKMVQELCQSTNPLGKSMDFLQEDLENMAKELENWSSERAQHEAKYNQELRTLEKEDETQQQLVALDTQITQSRYRINGVKAQILRNDESITRLLKMVIGS